MVILEFSRVYIRNRYFWEQNISIVVSVIGPFLFENQRERAILPNRERYEILDDYLVPELQYTPCFN